MSDEVADRSSNIDFEDCEEDAKHAGSGICSNCEADGGYCPECGGTGRCQYCEGTGRRRIGADPELLAEIAAHGPLIVPDADAFPADEDEGGER